MPRTKQGDEQATPNDGPELAPTPNDAPELAPTPNDAPAPKGATLDGLKPGDEIEIVHPDTGQTYGVSVKAYQDLYEPLGYKPARMGDNSLLPGDPRAPKDVPEDAPAAIIPQPEGEAPETPAES